MSVWDLAALCASVFIVVLGGCVAAGYVVVGIARLVQRSRR